VGSTSITRDEFEQNFEQGVRNYRLRAVAELPEEFRPLFRRQLLEFLIRQRLIELEVHRRGLVSTYEEAESQLRKDPVFQNRGVFDEAKFLAIKHSQPVQFRQAIEQLRHVLAAQRFSGSLEKENRPDRVELRARLSHSLTTASLEFLALRWSDFAGDYPEPREAEILQYYHSHLEDFRRPEEAALSVVFVNQPPLGESRAANEHARRTWEAWMKQRADSVLAALRNGANLDSVAAALGGTRRNANVQRNDFPNYWRGGPGAVDAVFAARPGTVLSDPIRGVSGYLIVRVDRIRPSEVAPVMEVAKQIRLTLRGQARDWSEDQEARALFQAVRDSLRGTAYRIRYAVADTGAYPLPEPSAAELDRFYRGHLADYSRFDPGTGGVAVRPLAEVREEVRARWVSGRREAAARQAAQQLAAAWSRGKRDPRLERAMTFVREVGPVPAGAVVDTGLAGAALTDTLAQHPGLGQGLMTFPRGLIVYHVIDAVRDYLPSPDQARSALALRMAARREQRDEAGARQLFDADRAEFRTGDIVRYRHLVVAPEHPLRVHLTREEVERYFKRHLDDYSAPELARVRHILISPKDAGPQADLAARRKAEDLLRRIRAGESFGALAHEYSDDEATRESGGDVGIFAHGMMLDAFEHAAFQMRVGDLTGPVKTEVGYHIMECLERAPQEVTPLKYCYSDVATSAALEKSEQMARELADSVYHSLKSPDQAVQLARSRGWEVSEDEHPVGQRIGVPDQDRFFATLETVKPGHFYPGIQSTPGHGWLIAWVLGVSPSANPSWEQARTEALSRYRRQAGQEATRAKRAELDSLQAAGWSPDSLAALWGGFETLEQAPGRGLSSLGGPELLDSLVFGGRRSPVLKPGAVSGWIQFPGGLVRLRVSAYHEPDPVELAQQVESEEKRTLERNLQAVYDRFKKSYPVRILDPELRATELPLIPGS
jgi:parvulin-like peptidyl-prolyl isomerase